MVFFFVPLTVSIMDCYEVFLDNGLILIVALVVGFFVPLAIVGALGSVLYRKGASGSAGKGESGACG